MVQTSLDEKGNQNSMHTLIYAITKHFLGEPMVFQEHALKILQNLRCRKLADFSWYKDVYLSKVYTRTDANQPFWKERFVHGLPKTLAERVRMRIKEKYYWIIPYDFLTYGELINFINKEALYICSLIKVNVIIKKDLRILKRELGSFCAQYGYEKILPSLTKQEKHYKSNKKKSYKKHSNFKEEPYYKKQKHRKYSNKSEQNPSTRKQIKEK